MIGYSQAEIDDIQAQWGLRFPRDLVGLLRKNRPLIGGQGSFDWLLSDPKDIQQRIDWPFESFWIDVKCGHVWWPEWGAKPENIFMQHEKLQDVFTSVPKLIPLFSHRYLPQDPFEEGNPVFSIYQTDIIYYGADLLDWMERELRGHDLPDKPWPPIKEIPFWSEATRKNS